MSQDFVRIRRYSEKKKTATPTPREKKISERTQLRFYSWISPGDARIFKAILAFRGYTMSRWMDEQIQLFLDQNREEYPQLFLPPKAKRELANPEVYS